MCKNGRLCYHSILQAAEAEVILMTARLLIMESTMAREQMLSPQRWERGTRPQTLLKERHRDKKDPRNPQLIQCNVLHNPLFKSNTKLLLINNKCSF